MIMTKKITYRLCREVHMKHSSKYMAADPMRAIKKAT